MILVNEHIRISVYFCTFLCDKDIGDLFGADLPVEGEVGACFEWRDGPFLKALKNGDWIVLDEVIFDCHSFVLITVIFFCHVCR